MWSNSAGEGPPFHESVRLWVFSFGQGLKIIAEVFQGRNFAHIYIYFFLFLSPAPLAHILHYDLLDNPTGVT